MRKEREGGKRRGGGGGGGGRVTINRCSSPAGLQCPSLVVDEYVGALEVSMKEVPLVAVVQRLHELQREALDMLLRELDHPRLQQTNQVVVTVLEHQVERTYRRKDGARKRRREREGGRDEKAYEMCPFPLTQLLPAHPCSF